MLNPTSITSTINGHQVKVNFDVQVYDAVFDEDQYSNCPGQVIAYITIDDQKLDGYLELQGDHDNHFALSPFAGTSDSCESEFYEILDSDESAQEFMSEIEDAASRLLVEQLTREIEKFKGELPKMDWIENYPIFFSDAVMTHNAN
jgi:hypothetical protein